MDACNALRAWVLGGDRRYAAAAECLRRSGLPVRTYRVPGMGDEAEDLEKALEDLKQYNDIVQTAEVIRDDVIPKMEHLRKHVDEAEMLASEKCWPFPSYGKLLFSVY